MPDNLSPSLSFTLNGHAYPLTPGLTLLALVRSLELDPARVAAAVNEDFYAAGRLPDRPLCPGDTVDVVRMMVGG